MNYLLILHIATGVALIGGFLFRYMGALRHQQEPKKGRYTIFGLISALIYSGILLVSMDQISLGSVMLTALLAITGYVVLEIALYRMLHRLAPTKHRES